MPIDVKDPLASRKPPLKAHLFVCTNRKDKGECCHPKGGPALRDKLKAWAKDQPWGAQVRVNAAGCLGRCEEGVTAVIYPAGEWRTGLQDDEASLQKLQQLLEETFA